MDITGLLIGRTMMLLMGAWMGLSSAFFAAFLWHGWQRKRPRRRGGVIKSDCPYCQGTGTVRDLFDEMAVCPLCDGARTLVAPTKELDR